MLCVQRAWMDIKKTLQLLKALYRLYLYFIGVSERVFGFGQNGTKVNVFCLLTYWCFWNGFEPKKVFFLCIWNMYYYFTLSCYTTYTCWFKSLWKFSNILMVSEIQEKIIFLHFLQCSYNDTFLYIKCCSKMFYCTQ